MRVYVVTKESLKRHKRNGGKYQCVKCPEPFKEGDMITCFHNSKRDASAVYYHLDCYKNRSNEAVMYVEQAIGR
jgi:hypothetical protein